GGNRASEEGGSLGKPAPPATKAALPVVSFTEHPAELRVAHKRGRVSPQEVREAVPTDPHHASRLLMAQNEGVIAPADLAAVVTGRLGLAPSLDRLGPGDDVPRFGVL